MFTPPTSPETNPLGYFYLRHTPIPLSYRSSLSSDRRHVDTLHRLSHRLRRPPRSRSYIRYPGVEVRHRLLAAHPGCGRVRTGLYARSEFFSPTCMDIRPFPRCILR